VTKNLLVVVALLTLTGPFLAGQSKPDMQRLAGTWKLNVAKSKYIPGPGPKSQMLTWKPTGSRFDFTIDTVNAQGQTTHSQASGAYDGHPYAFKTATTQGMRTGRWIDADTFEETDTVDGKVRTNRRVVISKDGKVLTITSKGTNAQGQATSNVTVYEKQ
jgi:hypothetical protein